ncbi:cytochrome B [Corynebacterium heidelbergense]|uniref:Cytochrome B n=1 Tax=Corynebacterium heidelbergense TaxID=2055947 RepID=A0A364V3L8_9CORY|nr:cytochrome B [Corynebacterium heidelbergense]
MRVGGVKTSLSPGTAPAESTLSGKPEWARQRLLAIILLICQTGITFTGSLVRVTGSGLGCNTWPQCHPGSFVPVPGAAPWIHQMIEFGNRLLTFVLAIAALATFIAVWRAGRRSAVKWLAFIQGIGIIVQAVLGGISVRLDLAWWSVGLHFLPSMLLVFFAAVLVTRIGEPDEAPVRHNEPPSLEILTHLSAGLLALTLITGVMVTGSGPHAGDAAIKPENRLQLPLVEIAHIHAHSMYLYLGVTIGLLAGLLAVRVPRNFKRATLLLIVGIILQAFVGIIQYWMGVPRWTVPLHVVGSGIVTAATGFLWSLMVRRQIAPGWGPVSSQKAVER